MSVLARTLKMMKMLRTRGQLLGGYSEVAEAKRNSVVGGRVSEERELYFEKWVTDLLNKMVAILPVHELKS